jgi:predicted RNA methylase
MKSDPKVLSVLVASRVEGTTLYLPSVALERSLYVAVNKCIESLGGKWCRKTKGHVFDSDPSDGLDNMLLTGEMADWKKELQFFPTPPALCQKICDLAELDSAGSVLEPSCGKGNIADEIYTRNTNLTCVEINRDMEKYLSGKPYSVEYADFLAWGEGREFDRIVMNPPFSKQQDVDHVAHAHSLLSVGGVLVSIVSPSPFFRDTKKAEKFRALIKGSEVIDVPDGAFKDSGTNIATKIIKVRKGEK